MIDERTERVRSNAVGKDQTQTVDPLLVGEVCRAGWSIVHACPAASMDQPERVGNGGLLCNCASKDTRLRVDPESRDSGFDALHRPGMTTKVIPRFTRALRRANWRIR